MCGILTVLYSSECDPQQCVDPYAEGKRLYLVEYLLLPYLYLYARGTQDIFRQASLTRPEESPITPLSKVKLQTISWPILLHMLYGSQQIPFQRIPEIWRIWLVAQEFPRPIWSCSSIASPCIQAHGLPARATSHLPNPRKTQLLWLISGD